MQTIVILLLIFLGVGLTAAASRRRLRAGSQYIKAYPFPSGLLRRLQQKHPELSQHECELVGEGLKQFFLVYLKSGRRFVSMPSQVVDDLWHEMILYTKTYQNFCRQAFGRFLHHTPAIALGSVRQSNAGLRRCWWYACREESLNPRAPTRLPLLFRLDEQLHITGGFFYALDCSGVSRNGSVVIHCGSDFADAGFDGTTDGFGDSIGDDSGSDGGDSGCSGGCGGGGD